MSELTLAVTPRTSLSPYRKCSPVLFTRPDQHPTAAASDLVSFGGSDDTRWTTACHWQLQKRRSCRARTMIQPPCILRSPAHQAQAWTPIFSASCLTLWRRVWNGLPQRNRSVATWMNGSCQSAARPLVNNLHHSSQRSTMKSLNRGMHPTRPAYVPLLPLPSLRSKAQKKKDTTACLPWMSQWPHISAHPRPLVGRQKPPTRPNHVGRLQLSLDEPIHQLDKRPQRFTPRWFCKFYRQNSSAPWMSLTQTPQLSMSCAVRPT